MKTVIGIVGDKTSGKSTAATCIKKYIEKHTNRQLIEAALADKLKNVCANTFNIPRNTFDDQRYKEIPFEVFNLRKNLSQASIISIVRQFGKSYVDYQEILDPLRGIELTSARHIAQIVGTQVLRALGDPDIHCKNVTLGNDVTVISDIRFPNEYNYFSNLPDCKFIPLYINRKIAEDEVDMEKSHESETSVFLFRNKCIYISNNGSVDDLGAKLSVILDERL